VYDELKQILRDAGMTVQNPGQHPDKCTSPYIVVQNTGTYPSIASNRTGYTLVTVHCYVPLNSYGKLQPLINSVKQAVWPHRSNYRPTGNEGIHVIDQNFMAHTSYIEYQVLRRLY